MNRYRVDLHIHTCLSPCGSLEMSPSVIVDTAIRTGLDAIAITDHNSTLQCPEIQRIGAERGLTVFAGVEVTSREEAHCVVLFPSDSIRLQFQSYLEEYLPHIPNDSAKFGDQVWVNRKDEIRGEVEWLLISGIDQSINRVASYARQSGCLFVPAHVERPSYSIISQLGFIDPTLPIDGIEYNNRELFEKLCANHPYLNNYTRYPASDAHYPDQIGTKTAILEAPALTFESLAKGLRGEDGCRLYAYE